MKALALSLTLIGLSAWLYREHEQLDAQRRRLVELEDALHLIQLETRRSSIERLALGAVGSTAEAGDAEAGEDLADHEEELPTRVSPSHASSGATTATEEPMTAQGMSDAVDEHFSGEPYDGAFASRTAPSLRAKLRSHLPAGSNIERVECRATICKVEVSHESHDAMATFLESALNSDDPLLGGGYMNSPAEQRGGRWTQTSYIAAQGVDLFDIVAAR